jgi:hypothetical protein
MAATCLLLHVLQALSFYVIFIWKSDEHLHSYNLILFVTYRSTALLFCPKLNFGSQHSGQQYYNSVLSLPDSRIIWLMERFEQKSYSLRMLYLYALYLVSLRYKFWTIWWGTKCLVHVKVIDLFAVRFLCWLRWHSGVLTTLHVWFPQSHWSRENIVKGNKYNPSCCKNYLCCSRGSNWWHRAQWVSVMT